MKRNIIISVLLLSTGFLLAQGNNKGDIIISISAGPDFANFLNSDAPHKINIMGSDVNPVMFMSASSITNSPAYMNYQTKFFKDILAGISAGIRFEYFLRQDISINAGLNFEPKGINLNYSVAQEGNVNFVYGMEHETDQIKITNKYLTVPVSCRKYLFRQKNFFVEGGFYLGYLLASQVNFEQSKTINDDNTGSLLFSYNFSYLFDDKTNHYTGTFDPGLTIGGGFVKNISKRLVLRTGFSLSCGLIKADSKYNNEYVITSFPSGTDFSAVLLRSTNYYGLNSNSRNLNFIATVGFGYKFGNKRIATTP
ncbi:MAG: outer membrane beta-barrel protein [Bacteroidales bacterium]|jgi:hypothetical protein